MQRFERWLLLLRHHPRLERAERIWRLLGPCYDRMLTLTARGGVERTINRTDSIRLHPSVVNCRAGNKNLMQRILYIQYTNPAAYPPLEHSSRILAQNGWQVLFLGTQVREVEALRFPPHSNILVRQLASCPAGWRQKFHYIWFILWTLGWVIRWRPRWIYASDSLSCSVGIVLSCIPGFRVIYHEHDAPGRFQSVFMRFVLWTRRQLARRARLCVIPNRQRLEAFVKEVGRRADVVCVWNCPSQEEVFSSRPLNNGRSLRILYQGAIGPYRPPMAVLDALTRLPRTVSLRVIGYEPLGCLGYARQLKEMACRLGVEARLEIFAPMSRDDMLKESQGCDVGLAFVPRQSENINFRYSTGASNKPFDYLAAGLALLVSDLPDWQEIFVEPGYGLACDPSNPEDIAEAIRWFLGHPHQMRVMGERGRCRILEEWNYERSFSPVLEFLNKGFRDKKG